MPPIVLPASFAPVEPEPMAEPIFILISDPAPIAEAGAMPPPQVGFELADLLLPLWLGGAAIFLALRVRDYLRMRRDLLAEARSVGEAGKVRLVETPAVASPIAFGITDKVVALPPLFMAHHDLNARDLAIAHELAHHRGYDLVANVAAQPLLALHWFNPLAWWGWRAMRRDQEAACDARVVAGRTRSERAAYGEVIAGFAAGPHLALAAPMACPVLGEKSIIHRLRSLTMSDIPSGRKKLGIAAIATTALVALPLTASISYAQEELPAVPEAPAAPVPPAAPIAPEAPLPPAAPEAPQVTRIVTIDPDDESRRVVRVRRIREAGAEARERATEARQRAGEARERAFVIRREFNPGEDIDFDFEEFDEAEFEARMAEFEVHMEELEGLDEEMGHALALAEARMEEGHRAMVIARENMPRIEYNCDESDQVVTQRNLDDGRKVMIICQRRVNDQAIMGLSQAIRSIRMNREMSAEQRDQLVDELRDQIERLESMDLSAVAPAYSPKVTPRLQAKAEARAPQAPAPVRSASASVRMVMPVLDTEEVDECDEAEEMKSFEAGWSA